MEDVHDTINQPTLNSEAGLTESAAAVAKGFSDEALHAGFIPKQTPLENREISDHTPSHFIRSESNPMHQKQETAEGVNINVHHLEESFEPTLNAEAGLTESAASHAHGFVDKQLHAGFISKQTPLPK